MLKEFWPSGIFSLQDENTLALFILFSIQSHKVAIERLLGFHYVFGACCECSENRIKESDNTKE
jgi:hypothetical protein